MASRGLRTLVLACRDFEKDEEWDEDLPAPDEHLTFIAVVGIKVSVSTLSLFLTRSPGSRAPRSPWSSGSLPHRRNHCPHGDW